MNLKVLKVYVERTWLQLLVKYPSIWILLKEVSSGIPSSELGLSSVLTPQSPASVPLPPEPGGGGRDTRLRARGWGSHNSDDLRKSWALFLLCATSFYSTDSSFKDDVTVTFVLDVSFMPYSVEYSYCAARWDKQNVGSQLKMQLCCVPIDHPWRKNWQGQKKRRITVTSSLHEKSSYLLGNRMVLGIVTPPTPTPFYSRLLDRYLKTTWMVFSPSRIFASWTRQNLSEPSYVSKFGGSNGSRATSSGIYHE